jgi:hypothetical protein
VIRQAISCDICGTEKKQTNHWFVAYDHGGELRVSGWESRNRLRPGSKHLCGQTCLHKLVDEFMARALATRAPSAAAAGETGSEAVAEEDARVTDTSLTSDAAYPEVESSARLIPTPMPRRPPIPMPIEMVSVQVKTLTEEAALPVEEPPRFTSRNWRAEAWERERERESHSTERRKGSGARRHSNS